LIGLFLQHFHQPHKHATLKGKYVLVGLAYYIITSTLLSYQPHNLLAQFAANANLPYFITSAPRYHHQRINFCAFQRTASVATPLSQKSTRFHDKKNTRFTKKH